MYKAILFCNLPYSFSILKPIADELKEREIDYIWYIPQHIRHLFNNKNEKVTSSIDSIYRYKSDMIFVPGNDVPYYLRGVKVQIFHGLAGEKKGHFRIRDYFDLYLTQGPYFTDRFNKLKQKHKNFEVVETGWSKLDHLFTKDNSIEYEKKKLLKDTNTSHIILYAPTFSPSLTSANILIDKINELSKNENFLILIKFHDKMDKSIIDSYKQLQSNRCKIIENDDITKVMKISDIMISDTSSVVYEFLLLNKPVITINSKSENINWKNIKNEHELIPSIEKTLFDYDKFKEQRDKIISMYHPYNDGKSSSRMVDAIIEYIEKYGVPTKRKISLLRKYKIIKKYGSYR